jgi:hypothetical protein
MNTFFWHLKLAALDNLDSLDGLVARPFRNIFDLVDNLVAFEDFAKHDVTSIKPAGDDGRDEELRTIGVWACVGHAQQALFGMLQLEVLVRKLVSVDRLPACAISFGEVAALNHEVLDDAMEGRPLVAEAFLAGRQGSEVLSGLQDLVNMEVKRGQER